MYAPNFHNYSFNIYTDYFYRTRVGDILRYFGYL